MLLVPKSIYILLLLVFGADAIRIQSQDQQKEQPHKSFLQHSTYWQTAVSEMRLLKPAKENNKSEPVSRWENLVRMKLVCVIGMEKIFCAF